MLLLVIAATLGTLRSNNDGHGARNLTRLEAERLFGGQVIPQNPIDNDSECTPNPACALIYYQNGRTDPVRDSADLCKGQSQQFNNPNPCTTLTDGSSQGCVCQDGNTVKQCVVNVTCSWDAVANKCTYSTNPPGGADNVSSCASMPAPQSS